MSIELGALFGALVALAGLAWTIVRTRRRERRFDHWVHAEATQARAEEQVEATMAAHREHVERDAQERAEMEQSLSEQRRLRHDLETELVSLKAELAKKQIELARHSQEVARLTARIDQLLAGDGTGAVGGSIGPNQ